MTRVKPVSWSELIGKLKKFGFSGPYTGGKHPYMIKEDLVLTIPNPHRKEIGIDLLNRILNQSGISKKAWVSIK